MHGALQDIRFAVRQLRKSPSFAAVAILTLALGIGASTIIFSVVYNGVLYPFPYRSAERLTTIQGRPHGHFTIRIRSENGQANCHIGVMQCHPVSGEVDSH